jgi:hypothetical protein
MQFQEWAQHNKGLLGGKDLQAKLRELLAKGNEQIHLSKHALLGTIEDLLDSNLVIESVIENFPFECQLLADAKELLS